MSTILSAIYILFIIIIIIIIITIRSQSQETGACLVVRLATQQDSAVRCSLLCIIHVCTFVYICSMRQFLTVVALRVT